jgi:hypothetical protein
MIAERSPKDRLRAHAKAFLERARDVRTALQAVAVAAPVAVAGLKVIPASMLNATGVIIVTTFEFVALAIGAATGLLVLLTDKSALAVMADAQDLGDQLDVAGHREATQNRYVEQLEWELTKAEPIALTVDSMRVAVDVALLPSPPPVNAQIGEMLDLLVASKSTLFGMGTNSGIFRSIFGERRAASWTVSSAGARPGRTRKRLTEAGGPAKAMLERPSRCVAL